MEISGKKISINYKRKKYEFTYKENEKFKIDINEIRILPFTAGEKAEILEIIGDKLYDTPIKSKAYYINYFIDRYILDFTGCKTVEEFYGIIGKGLYFPEYYGGNIDAVWDCITWEIDKSKPIEIVGLNTLKGNLKEDRDDFLILINDFMREFPECSVKIM